MTITERTKQDARMISRPLYIFLGHDEKEQLFWSEEPEDLYLTPDGKIVFDAAEVIEVNKKSFFLVTA